MNEQIAPAAPAASQTTSQDPAPASAEAGQAPAQAPAHAAPATPPAAPSTPEPATTLLGSAAASKMQQPTEPAGEAKAQEPAQATEAEVELELKLPEGMKPDEALLGGFRPLAKELGLKQEQAQQLVDLYVSRQQAALEEARANQNVAVRAWIEDVRKDPELGGAAFEKNVSVALQAAQKFGGAGLLEVLEKSGLGSHPEVVRAFYRMGRLMQPDQAAATIGSPPPKVAKKPWEILYQNSHFKEKR